MKSNIKPLFYMKCWLEMKIFLTEVVRGDAEGYPYVRDWVLAQMALVESCDAAVDEVFLPYMTDNSGKTLYQMYSAGRLLPAVH